MKLRLTWSLDPANVNDLRAVIIVQQERIPQDHFMAYTDAVQGLTELAAVVAAKAMGNRMTHHLKFGCRLDRDLVDQIEAAVEMVYQSKCEAIELEPLKIKWTYTGHVGARIGAAEPPAKPPSRKDLVQQTAQAEVPKIILNQLREAAALTKSRVDSGELAKGDAWEFLHFLITQEVITS